MCLICYIYQSLYRFNDIVQLTRDGRIDFRAQNFFNALLLSIRYQTMEVYQGRKLFRVECDYGNFVDWDMNV